MPDLIEDLSVVKKTRVWFNKNDEKYEKVVKLLDSR